MSSSESTRPLGISDSVQSSYYPPGWNRDRLIAASKDDIFAIPPEEFEKLRQGMMAAMGAEGFQSFVRDLLAKEIAAAPAPAPSIPMEPNYLKAIQHQYQGQPWGFVVYRATSYGNDAQWRQFQQKWNELVDLELDNSKDVPGISDARQNLTWHWIERPELEGASLEQISRDYTELSSPTASSPLQSGVNHSLCLVITKESFDSILNADNSTRNLKTSDSIQPAPPFVVAVSNYIEQEEVQSDSEDDVRPSFVSFKHSVWTLLEGLFAAVGNQVTDPWEMGYQRLGESAIWLSFMLVYKNGRYQKAGGRGRGQFLD